MFRNRVIQILLSPFSLLYGIGVSIRNFLYSVKLLKAVKFSVPTISIGNITVGGTGKTPHIEYLIRLLQDYINVGTMSRGYGRKTSGFKMVQRTSTAREVGDEPLQFKLKFPHLPVSVAESRALGIPDLLGRNPQINTILLDDAFQHLSVTPHINILLTTYERPYFKDFLMPSGRLREWPSGAMRADAIILTKCPRDMTREEREKWIEEIDPTPSQSVFFSTMIYGNPYSFFNSQERISLESLDGVVLLTAIADSNKLEQRIRENVDTTLVMEFEDHHYFTSYEVTRAINNFKSLEADNKVLLTTEKDAMRLIPFRNELRKNNVPVFLLPIQVKFLFQEIHNFDDYIKSELLKIKV